MRNYMAELSAPPAPVRTLDTTVRVSCEARLVYPSLMEKVLHPELQKTGPAQYDLRVDVVPWRHDRQKGGTDPIRGKAVYEYLKTGNEIDSCLGLVDRAEIKKMGAPVFREIFGDRAILFFLRSTIAGQRDFLYAPCLFLFNNEVRDRWFWIGGFWSADYLVLRFN